MKVIEGHLTAHDKTAIKAILAAGSTAGQIGKKSFYIFNTEGVYTVKIATKDRGLIPCTGSELRISTYTHKFTL